MSALAACAVSLALTPAAQARTAEATAAVTAPYRAPGDVTLTGGDFGTVEVGDTGTVTLTLTNNGTGAVGFDGLPLNLPDGVTRTGGTCDLDAALLAGESCTFELTWTPTAEGPYTGSVSLTADDDGSVYVVTAQVTGNATVTPTPAPTPTPTPTPTHTWPTSHPSHTGPAWPGHSEPPHLAETGSGSTGQGVLLGLAAVTLGAAGFVLTRRGRGRTGAHQ